MVRDPELEEMLHEDLAALEVEPSRLTEKPMFGGLCFLLDGHMLCACREDRAMYRVGRAHEAQALALADTRRMVHNRREYPGWAWLTGESLSNDKTRARLTAWALDTVRALPPKE